ncbi:unnamed protein product, partial [Didymodactylos carnosus]
ERGLLSRLLSGGSSKSVSNSDGEMVRERSKIRELLRNPIVIGLLSAAVGMLIQKALESRNVDKNSICENNYVKMASMASATNPQLKQLLDVLGCTEKSNIKKPSTSSTDDESNITDAIGDDGSRDEHISKLSLLKEIFRGEKGAKRKFLKSLFGLKSKERKAGEKLPKSNYELDKSDAQTMNDLQKELNEHGNKFD